MARKHRESDEEAGQSEERHHHGPLHPETAFQFSERSVRRKFVRKVYSILSSQIIVTIVITVALMFTPGFAAWFIENWWLAILILVVCLILMIVLACFESARRCYPCNLILLLSFTLLYGFLVGVICVYTEAELVLYAFGITAAVVIALTLFAFQPWVDVTSWGLYLFVALIVLLTFGIICIFIRSRILHLVYCALVVLIYSFYLVYDTQMMLGGNHKYAISPEEYVMASLNLYLDIVVIFLYILELLRNT